MNALKGIAIGLLSFLLFLSLVALGLALTLNSTVLNPDFVVKELDKTNAYFLVEDQIRNQVPTNIDPIIDNYLTPALNTTFNDPDFQSWIRDQASQTIHNIYSYLKSATDNLNISVDIASFKQYLKDNLWKEFQKSPPTEAAGLSAAEQQQYFDQYYSEFSTDIPDSLQLDQNSIPSDMGNMVEQVKHYLSYFNIILWGLIGFTIILIAGIALINRQVKASTRSLGITFTVYGALGVAAILAVRHFVEPRLAQMDIPNTLQPVIAQVLNDISSPSLWFTACSLIVGVAMIIVSRVYKPKEQIIDVSSSLTTS